MERIDAQNRTALLQTGERLSYDSLVIATGARARRLNAAGENINGIFYLRDVADALRIKAYLRENSCRKAVLIGGGYTALEMCESFRLLGMETMLLLRSERPLRYLEPALSELVAEELKNQGVRIVTGTSATGFTRLKKGSIHVETSGESIDTDIVLISIGIKPETNLAEAAGIQPGTTGAVAVDGRMQTSQTGIYAAGDCCECLHLVSNSPFYEPLGDVANKQGRVAGTNIAGGMATFPGVVGSSCLKVFDLEVGSTGLNIKEAKAAGFDPQSSFIKGSSPAGKFPEAAPLWIQLIADKSSGRLLGAQAVGAGAVARINALALAVTARMGVEQLAMADFAYSPPFSGAWDPIHIAASKLAK